MSQKESLSATGATAPLRRLNLELLPCLALGIFCWVFLERRTGEIVLACLSGTFCLALLFRMALAPPFPWRGFAILAMLFVPLIGHTAVERYRASRVDR